MIRMYYKEIADMFLKIIELYTECCMHAIIYDFHYVLTKYAVNIMEIHGNYYYTYKILPALKKTVTKLNNFNGHMSFDIYETP